MNGIKGDYMGFSYGTKEDGTPMHSSDLGIVRVSDGSRFNENLLPTIQDKTVQVPGGDGTYYFGSYYTQRQFNISFAFDALTEAGIARLKRHFGDKKIHDLIFDETPYKIYNAKVTGTTTIKYIPFAEGATNRLYKGEGSIQFTCYTPFARSRFTNWTSAIQNSYPNFQEWKEASGIINTANFNKAVYAGTDSNGVTWGNAFPIYNPGDFDTDFTIRLYAYSLGSSESDKKVRMFLENTSKSSFLEWEPILKLKTGDSYIVINTKTNLLEGWANDASGNHFSTGNIYNEYLTDGDFFKLPQTKVTEGDKIPALKFDNMKFKTGSYPLLYNYYYY